MAGHPLDFSIVSDGGRGINSSRGLNRPAAFLYGVAGPAGAFNDITVGSNTGVELPDNDDDAPDCDPAKTTAFTARKGWDATTGRRLPLDTERD
jgi:hypothetical protein